MRKKKGFTLLEVVVTLSILGISFGLTAGTVAALINIQKSTAHQNAINSQLNSIDKAVSDYISYVSIPNFEYVAGQSDDKTVTFQYDSGYLYKLSYSNNQLTFTTNHPVSDDYFYKNELIDVPEIKSLTFSYNETLKLLTSIVSYDSNSISYAYVVRTN